MAGALLVADGDNPERLRSEAAFAALCGVSPVPASSGKTTRHRLNRGGDRIANSALWRIVMVRLTCDGPTRRYMERRIAEGKSKRAGHHVRPIRGDDLDIDYPSATGSRERLWARYGGVGLAARDQDLRAGACRSRASRARDRRT